MAVPTYTWAFFLALVLVFVALIVGGVVLLVVRASRSRPRPARARAEAEYARRLKEQETRDRPLPVARPVRPPQGSRSGSQLGFTPTGAILGGLLILSVVFVGIVAAVTGEIKLALLVGLNLGVLWAIGLIVVGVRAARKLSKAAAAEAAVPVTPPPRADGSSKAVSLLAGFSGVILVLGIVVAVSFGGRAPEPVGIVAFLLMIVVAMVGTGTLLVVTTRERTKEVLRAAAPAAEPKPAPPAPRPTEWKVGWLVGLPIGVAVALGVILTTANGGHIGMERADVIMTGALVAFGAVMLVRVFRQPAPPAEAPAVAAPAVEAPVVPLVTTPAAPRACPKCGRPIAAGAPEGLCPRCLIGDLLPDEPKHSPTTAYGPFVPPEVEEVAPFFPQLEIVRLIGQGGMGAVYLARQKQLDRLVALKLINVREDDPTFAERFAREAKAMGKLSHPNIVTIHDHGTADGLPFLVMEFVDGVTLRDAMRAKTLTPAEALKVIPQVCDALEYAHKQGVVHRDVKPENILLDKSGKVKIADFGLAKLVDPDGLSLTHTRQAMGTPHYMAPEQWERPTEVDHRADIYALGVLLYELLTGELPLGRFDPPSVKARVDARIDELVLRALAKEPGRRYQHASDVKAALANIDRTPGRGRCGARRSQGYYEYTSAATFLGWPLVHIVRGADPATGRAKTARGWLAIGDEMAVGGLAIAGAIARGGLAIGGGGALGVVALAGGWALGGVALAGGGAAGLLAAGAGGGAAAGLIAGAGGVSAGTFAAAGGAAFGKHTFSGANPDAAGFWAAFQAFWEKLAGNFFTNNL
jgi:predicted Ser/Thr protein kinase